jgi:hypothetical protein
MRDLLVTLLFTVGCIFYLIGALIGSPFIVLGNWLCGPGARLLDDVEEWLEA